MSALVRAGFLGAVAGATAGAPRRGQPHYRPMAYYEPIPKQMAPSPVLDAWLALAAAARHGLPAESAPTLYVPDGSPASRFAKLNLDSGLLAPMSGWWRNPLREDALAIGRAAGWGLAFFGRPDLAIAHAYFDAATDHADGGLWSAVAAAAMLAASGDGALAAIRAAQAALPPGGRTAFLLGRALQLANSGLDPAKVCGELAFAADTRDCLDAALNLGYLAFAVARGAGDFARTVTLAAGAGGASDQTALVAGALAAVAAGVPDDWSDPLGSAYVSAAVFPSFEVPETIEEAAHRFAGPAPIEPAPEDAHGDEWVGTADATDPEPEPVEAPAPPDPLPAAAAMLHRISPASCVARFGAVSASVEAVDGLIARHGRGAPLKIAFALDEGEEQILEPAIEAPDGWEVAHRLTDFRLRPGDRTEFPAVVQPGESGPARGIVRIVAGPHALSLPIDDGQRWYRVGPFPNDEGIGYDKPYRPEDVRRLGEVFNGRSNLPVKWEETRQPGILFDVEPWFGDGPGVIYLWARVSFGERAPNRVVAVSGNGSTVWVDGARKLTYHDQHRPSYRPGPPYLAEISTRQPCEILWKITRGKAALPPAALYFLGPDGAVIEPAEFLAMDP